jgi:hypothetical protein
MRPGGVAEGMSSRCSESGPECRPMHLLYALIAYSFSLLRIIINVLRSRKYSMNAPALLAAFSISIWPSPKTA